jgi:hypothetical protein
MAFSIRSDIALRIGLKMNSGSFVWFEANYNNSFYKLEKGLSNTTESIIIPDELFFI